MVEERDARGVGTQCVTSPCFLRKSASSVGIPLPHKRDHFVANFLFVLRVSLKSLFQDNLLVADALGDDGDVEQHNQKRPRGSQNQGHSEEKEFCSHTFCLFQHLPMSALVAADASDIARCLQLAESALDSGLRHAQQSTVRRIIEIVVFQ